MIRRITKGESVLVPVSWVVYLYSCACGLVYLCTCVLVPVNSFSLLRLIISVCVWSQWVTWAGRTGLRSVKGLRAASWYPDGWWWCTVWTGERTVLRRPQTSSDGTDCCLSAADGTLTSVRKSAEQLMNLQSTTQPVTWTSEVTSDPPQTGNRSLFGSKRLDEIKGTCCNKYMNTPETWTPSQQFLYRTGLVKTF